MKYQQSVTTSVNFVCNNNRAHIARDYFKANPSKHDSYWTRVIDLRVLFHLYYVDRPFIKWVIHSDGSFCVYSCQKDIDNETGPNDKVYDSYPAEGQSPSKIDFSLIENLDTLQYLYIDDIYDYHFRVKSISNDGTIAVLQRRRPLEIKKARSL